MALFRTVIEQEIGGKYIIIAHSLGAYLVASMLLRTTDSEVHRFCTKNLESVIFMDPWGFTTPKKSSGFHALFSHDERPQKIIIIFLFCSLFKLNLLTLL